MGRITNLGEFFHNCTDMDNFGGGLLEIFTPLHTLSIWRLQNNENERVFKYQDKFAMTLLKPCDKSKLIFNILIFNQEVFREFIEPDGDRTFGDRGELPKYLNKQVLSVLQTITSVDLAREVFSHSENLYKYEDDFAEYVLDNRENSYSMNNVLICTDENCKPEKLILSITFNSFGCNYTVGELNNVGFIKNFEYEVDLFDFKSERIISDIAKLTKEAALENNSPL